MSEDPLGRLTRVELRDIWSSEAGDFTPWLAQESNLAVLGETLGIDLELEAQEKDVGPFRADILCRDTATGAWVLVENQLERTDHRHLGQLLTYASGLQAVMIIWIAARFTEEHRSTLDWLNKITDENFRFFGLEAELWKIGESRPAPKFNVVSRPNDWSRSVAQAAWAIDETELSPLRLMQREYWTHLHQVLDHSGGPVSGQRKARPSSLMSYPIGRSEMNLNAVMIRSHKRIRAELYLRGKNAKAHFHLLNANKDALEKQSKFPLVWEELPDRQDSRIAVYFNDMDPEDRENWPHQHRRLADSLNDLHRVFAERVHTLDADDWDGESAARE